jgi:hypothetical protein
VLSQSDDVSNLRENGAETSLTQQAAFWNTHGNACRSHNSAKSQSAEYVLQMRSSLVYGFPHWNYQMLASLFVQGGKVAASHAYVSQILRTRP